MLPFYAIKALLLAASCCLGFRIWLLGCCCTKELGVQMLRVDGVVVCRTLSIHDRSVAGGCRSFTINPPSSQLSDRSSW